MKIALATPCGTPWRAVTGVEAACTIALAFMLNAMPVMVLASDSCPTASGSRSYTAARRFAPIMRMARMLIESSSGSEPSVQVRLDRVRERVGARRRDDVRRGAEHQLRIDDRDSRGQVARGAHHLEVLGGVGDHDHERHLGAGTARRGHAHDGWSGRRDEILATVVPDRAAVLDQRGGGLRGVHRATAAEADQPVAALSSVEVGDLGEIRRGRILLRVPVGDRLDPGTPMRGR